MSELIVNSAEEYRLLVEGDLLSLVRQAVTLEREYGESEEYSDRRQTLEHQLYDLYQEIGWSVVYDMKDVPF